MKLAIVAVLLLSGCGLAQYQPKSADEMIRIVKEAGGTGCYYRRIDGTSRPYVDSTVRDLVVTTVGKGTSYKDCMANAAEAQAIMAPK